MSDAFKDIDMSSVPEYEYNVISYMNLLIPLASIVLLGLEIYVIRSIHMRLKAVMILIHNLACCEFLCDIGYVLFGTALFTSNYNTQNSIQSAALFLIYFGGISGMLYITLIILTIFYVIFMGKVIDIDKKRVLVYTCVHTLPFVLGVYKWATVTNVNFIIFVQVVRGCILALNIALLLILMVDSIRKPKSGPASIVIKQVVWYPILECIARSIAWWFLYVFYIGDKYNFGACVLSTLCLACLGGCYSIIYFLSQPLARKKLEMILTCSNSPVSYFDEQGKADDRTVRFTYGTSSSYVTKSYEGEYAEEIEVIEGVTSSIHLQSTVTDVRASSIDL